MLAFAAPASSVSPSFLTSLPPLVASVDSGAATLGGTCTGELEDTELIAMVYTFSQKVSQSACALQTNA
jgi:hypothetical protein